jgi:hypothetical protein
MIFFRKPVPTFRDHALQRTAKDLIAKGTSVADAPHQALGLIARLLEQQASLLVYIDVFFGYAIFVVMMIAVAFLLRRVEGTQAHVAA